jgi:hypothetical protein
MKLNHASNDLINNLSIGKRSSIAHGFAQHGKLSPYVNRLTASRDSSFAHDIKKSVLSSP